MDKEEKKATKNGNFQQNRGQNKIKGQILDDIKETLSFIVSRKSEMPQAKKETKGQFH